MSMNIYQRLNNIMKAVKYVQKDAHVNGSGAGYKAVTHDQVIAVTREHFVSNGVVIQPAQLKGEIVVEKSLDAKTPVKMLTYAGDYNVMFVNIDNPEDYIGVPVQAHACDNGDKAPGKAMTYATKTAILKILSLETGVNDESRTYEPELYRPEEKEELDRILEDEDHIAAVVMQQTLNVDVQTALFNSFEKGKKTQSKNKLRDLQAKGWVFFKSVAAIVQDQNEDETAVLESISELNDNEKRVLMGLLTDEDVDRLKKIKEGSK